MMKTTMMMTMKMTTKVDYGYDNDNNGNDYGDDDDNYIIDLLLHPTLHLYHQVHNRC
jgi:hypothetical protein